MVYLLGLLFTSNFVLIFIVTILLLAADFYYLKNIAGRRLVGLRWWNEVEGQSGDSHWVFESAPQPNEPGGKLVNPTDKRFFWLALYAQPAFWVALAIVAIVRFEFIWLTLVGKPCLDATPQESALIASSHCYGAYDHEHSGFLPLRQVQSSKRRAGERPLFWLSGEKYRRSHGLTHFQQRLACVL